jgi:iron complex outermembrane receptor protein
VDLSVQNILNKTITSTFVCILVCFNPTGTICQNTDQNLEDTLISWIQPVEVTAARLNLQDLKSPLAVSVTALEEIQSANSNLNLQELLSYTPGLIAMNGYNYAQDVRISLRGYGARAAFGVRGIKVFLDDIPATSPDGQTQVDHIDPGMVKRIEVVKGPSSGIYGNASGGIVSLYTDPIDPGFSLTTEIGQNQLFYLSGNFSETSDVLSFSGSGIYSSYDGYRSFSGTEQALFYGKLAWRPGNKSEIRVTLNLLNSPKADDPGGLTSSEVAMDPTQASSRNLLFKAGESVTQGIGGIRWKYDWDQKNSVIFTSYYNLRDFQNRLPFENGGQVDLHRNFGGWDIHWDSKKDMFSKPARLSLGIGFEDQKDRRRRFNNLEGKQGNLTFEQTERFKSFGIYSSQEISLSSRLQLLTRIRFDIHRLEAIDRLLADGDESGKRNYNRFSPLVGINYQICPSNHSYITVSHGFEVPTLAELSNNPDGSGGFNPVLNPQKSWNFEWGFKGILGKGFKYEFALFHIDLHDETVPFELADQPGRSFYRNSGRSKRTGVETGIKVHLTKNLSVWSSYTYSDFKFQEFQVEGVDLSGNRTPGIPVHHGQLFILYKTGQFQLGCEYNYYDAMFTDDANSTLARSTNLFHLRTAFEISGKPNWKLFAGIRNVFDTRYHQNIRINAAANRFYEPGPSRFFYAGVQIQKLKKSAE